jgi:hypothetical protein
MAPFLVLAVASSILTQQQLLIAQSLEIVLFGGVVLAVFEAINA